MPDWPNPTVREAEIVQLRTELAIAENNAELAAEEISESFADAELAMEDRGWWRLTSQAQIEFSRNGLTRITDIARVSATANPLIKRGVALRTAYVWGQGISIAARDEAINQVVQDFLDDPGNQKALHSGKAHERQERTLATDGNLIFGLFTSPLAGRVQVRTFLFEEIIEILTNPEDRNEPWYYLRQWSTVGLVPSGTGAGAASVNQIRRTYHPALGYTPASKPKVINGIPVAWDTPVLHEKVNEHDGWQYGIGDVYAALPWARMYGEFLVDWARIARALSKFAWRLSGDRSSKARTAAAKIRQVTADAADVPALGGVAAGQMAAGGPGVSLDAIPKTGATLDANSGKPLAGMAASALGIPVTMLLADPGQTGARAVAETLDRPTELEMAQRRDLHVSIRRRILDYVIDQAVIAPAGPLKGQIKRAPGNRLEVALPADVERTVDIVFPEMTQQDPAKLIEAIAAADGTQTLPPLTIARLLLQALGVDDVDEILTDMTDADGNFIPPTVTAGQAAVDRFNAGQDPASL